MTKQSESVQDADKFANMSLRKIIDMAKGYGLRVSKDQKALTRDELIAAIKRAEPLNRPEVLKKLGCEIPIDRVIYGTPTKYLRAHMLINPNLLAKDVFDDLRKRFPKSKVATKLSNLRVYVCSIRRRMKNDGVITLKKKSNLCLWIREHLKENQNLDIKELRDSALFVFPESRAVKYYFWSLVRREERTMIQRGELTPIKEKQ